ncbi:receptor-like kinase, partial [Trifolium medium]|nr:receptor-like kinase [Trifolium medium]
MGQIHHLNVVCLLGFCADGFHRALVYNFFPNGSLQKFISPPSNEDSFLGWDKLQKIALGIANGIEYLHQ